MNEIIPLYFMKKLLAVSKISENYENYVINENDGKFSKSINQHAGKKCEYAGMKWKFKN